MGPVRISHSSHDFWWQSSHSVDLAGWQAKMACIEIWIPSPSGFVPPLSNGTSRATSDRKPKTNDQILTSCAQAPLHKSLYVYFSKQAEESFSWWQKNQFRPNKIRSLLRLIWLKFLRAVGRFYFLMNIFYTHIRHANL